MGTKKISNVKQLKDMISILRATGVHTLSEREIIFQIRLHIIQQCNPRKIRFGVSKLPVFTGNFDQYQMDCLIFFNEKREKK